MEDPQQVRLQGATQCYRSRTVYFVKGSFTVTCNLGVEDVGPTPGTRDFVGALLQLVWRGIAWPWGHGSLKGDDADVLLSLEPHLEPRASGEISRVNVRVIVVRSVVVSPSVV